MRQVEVLAIKGLTGACALAHINMAFICQLIGITAAFAGAPPTRN